MLRGILAESAADRNNSFSITAFSLLVLPRIVRDERDVRENFFPRTQLMRSLSFLLVTYYAVLNLFVTQIVLDNVPSLPFTSIRRCELELGRLKIARLAKLTKKGAETKRETERERERERSL